MIKLITLAIASLPGLASIISAAYLASNCDNSRWVWFLVVGVMLSLSAIGTANILNKDK